MELRRYLTLFTNQWYVIAAAVVAAVLAAVLLTPSGTRYQAGSTIYVGSRTLSTDPSSRDLSADRLVALERVINTFSAMIDSQPIATEAIAAAGTDDSAASLVSRLSAAPIEETQLIRVTVTDSDPTEAASLANAVAETFVAAVQQFEPTGTGVEGEIPQLPAYVFERARTPTQPLPTGLVVNFFVAIILGGSLGIGVVLLLDYLNLTIRTHNDVESRLGLLVMGVIPDLGPAGLHSPGFRVRR